MLGWLTRGIGDFAAPDPNYQEEEKPGYSGLARFLAPPPPEEEETPLAAAAPKTPAAASRPAPAQEGFQTPAAAAEGLQTPSTNTTNSELDQKVLFAAKTLAHTMVSPTKVIDSNNKVFRMCASNRPLVETLETKLKKSFAKDQSLLTARSVHLGALVPDGMTPLMAAAFNGNTGAAGIILEADLSDTAHLERDLQGRTALHIASQGGNVEVAKMLLEKHKGAGVKPESLVDLTGRTPLGVALTSPLPKAKKNSAALEKLLFSPRDESVFGSPEFKKAPNNTLHRPLSLAYGQAEMPGMRVVMEDAIVATTWQSAEDGAFYGLLGVCDGHGDRGKVSEFVSQKIKALLQSKPLPPTDWQKLWTDACLEVDRDLKAASIPGGSTGVFALVTQKEIVVANVGDSRCILVVRGKDEPKPTMAEVPTLVEEEPKSEAEADGAQPQPAGTEEAPPSLAEETKDDGGSNEADSAQPSEADTPQKEKVDQTEDVPPLVEEKEKENVSTTEAESVPPPQQGDTQEADKATETTTTEKASANFEVIALSEDHKPNLPEEKARVEAAGMKVIEETFKEKDGQEVTIHKVQKNSSKLLAVSRAFGDFEYKNKKEMGPEEQAVIAVPEVRVHPRNAQNDLYLVAACDGIWDVMSSEAVARFVVEKAEQQAQVSKVRLPDIGDQLVRHCLDLGSRDNMSVAIAGFSEDNMEKFATTDIQGQRLEF